MTSQIPIILISLLIKTDLSYGSMSVFSLCELDLFCWNNNDKKTRAGFVSRDSWVKQGLMWLTLCPLQSHLLLLPFRHTHQVILRVISSTHVAHGDRHFGFVTCAKQVNRNDFSLPFLCANVSRSAQQIWHWRLIYRHSVFSPREYPVHLESYRWEWRVITISDFDINSSVWEKGLN